MTSVAVMVLPGASLLCGETVFGSNQIGNDDNRLVVDVDEDDKNNEEVLCAVSLTRSRTNKQQLDTNSTPVARMKKPMLEFPRISIMPC